MPHTNFTRAALGLVIVYFVASPCLALACTPFIEEHPSWASASFRPHTSAFEHCEVDEQSYRQVISEWLHTRAADSGAVSSLSLGRAVTFPWLSRHIADSALQTPGWAARVARAKPGERDSLAAPILRDPELLHRLAAPFEGTQYTIRSISFEKVLFGRADEYSSNKSAGAVKVPFDAQLWLQLAPRGQNE
jgi:hypothetical protein